MKIKSDQSKDSFSKLDSNSSGKRRVTLVSARGNWQKLKQRPKLVIIASRAVSVAGQKLLEDWLPRLIRAEVLPVALITAGIGELVHQIAFDLKAPSVGVALSTLPGSKADENLEEKILKQGGAILAASNRPVSGPWIYSKANELLAQTGDGLWLVEARENSGCLSVVDSALKQKAQIMISPGRPGDQTTSGSNQLLHHRKIKIVIAPEEILTALGLSSVDAKVSNKDIYSTFEQTILESIKTAPRTLDELLALTGLDSAELASSLLELQIKGLVTESAGWYRYS